VNLGIIGFGYTGQQHARAVKEGGEIALAAIAEPDAAKRARATVRAYDDFRSLLQNPAIDAVSICLPHFLHEEVADASLRAGKHVLIEKPLAMTASSGERLCALALLIGRVLMVEMTHRFMPPIVQARDLVMTGQIGEIVAVNDVLIEGIGLLGSLPAWMFNRAEAGGGVGLTSGIHLLDRITWVTGQPLILDSARFSRSPKLGDVENVASYSLHLSNGAPVQILLGWRPESTCLDGELAIFGTKGTLSAQSWSGWKLTNDKGFKEQIYFDDGRTIAQRACEGMKRALCEFAAAVREDRPPDPRPEESLESQRLIEQAYRFL